ncbi:C-type lectin domain family 4 member F [Erinaceus europaeus]|uniref:C-type lectin domain family 4 member F n=1 Tax=Erinaceus europaeus TaxID=9365 RepID=A0A1S3WC01_ERIEU|nr:C-type lectin domain family 4 member F [Erinaceus europaeus]
MKDAEMRRDEVLFNTDSQSVSLQPRGPESEVATPTNFQRQTLVQATLVFMVITIISLVALFVMGFQKPRHAPAAQTSQEFPRDNSIEALKPNYSYYSQWQDTIQKLKDQSSTNCGLEIQMLTCRVDNINSQIQLLSGHLENTSADIQVVKGIITNANNTLSSQTQLLRSSLEGATIEIQKLKRGLDKAHALNFQTQSLLKNSSENNSAELHKLNRSLENANTEIQALKVGLEMANAQSQETNSSLKSANALIHVLKGNLSHVNDLMTQSQVLRSSLEGANAEIQRIKGNLQNANALNSQTQSFIRGGLDNTSAEIQLLKGHLERARAESHLLKNDLEKVTTQTQQTNSHLEQTDAQLQVLKREMKNIDALNSQNQVLIGQLKNAHVEIQTLKQGMKATEALDSKTQILERDLKKANVEIQRLKGNLANTTALAMKIQETQSGLETLRATFASQEQLQSTQDQLLQLLLQGWMAYSGNLYYFSDTKKSWNEAEKFCVSNKAHLTSMTSVEEQNFLTKYTKNSFYWIGLTDSGTEGSWRWTDGTPFNAAQNKKFWSKNQPDNWRNKDGKFEDCVHMQQEWNDINCDNLYQWICKKPSGQHVTVEG